MTQFEEIYGAYFREVYLYAFALTKDREQAQEITSETFARALEGIDRFRGDCDVRYWLCRIAKNCYTTALIVVQKAYLINAFIVNYRQ